jgi:hypothetical protein
MDRIGIGRRQCELLDKMEKGYLWSGKRQVLNGEARIRFGEKLVTLQPFAFADARRHLRNMTFQKPREPDGLTFQEAEIACERLGRKSVLHKFNTTRNRRQSLKV